MISITIESGRVVAYLEKIPVQVRGSVLKAVNAAAIELQGYIRRDKLHGGVLKARTGNLSRAITFVPAREEGTRIIAQVVVDATAPYGVFHEYGVAHSWEIEARGKKALRFEVGGKVVFAKRVTHPGLKERSFMRSALADRRESILARIRAAVRERLGGQ